jgi:hypothetical protein
MKHLKTSFKIVLFIMVSTVLIWPCIAYMYDPKGETVGWYLLTLSITILSIIGWIMFGNPEKEN